MLHHYYPVARHASATTKKQGPWGELREMRAESHADMPIRLQGKGKPASKAQDATHTSVVPASLLLF